MPRITQNFDNKDKKNDLGIISICYNPYMCVSIWTVFTFDFSFKKKLKMVLQKAPTP